MKGTIEQKYKELVNDWDIAVDYVLEPYKLKWLFMAAPCVADADIIFFCPVVSSIFFLA